MRKLLCALSILAAVISGCGGSENAVFTAGGGSFVGGNSIANDDAYSTFGNAQISVDARQGLLANDALEGDSVAANTEPGNGTVSVNPDGSFTYIPTTGFRGATDSFTYTLTNGSSATVTISFAGVAWFVDNSAEAAKADGSLTTPFTTTSQAQTASQPGDIIFLFFGDGSPYGPITLQNNQRLVGQVSGLVAAQTVVDTPAGRPVITHSSGNGVTLANGNTVTGIEVRDTLDSGIFGSGVEGVILDDVLCTGNGDKGVRIETLSGTFDFDNIEVRQSGDDSIFLPNCSGTGTIDNCRSVGAGDDGLDMDFFSGTVTVRDCTFTGDLDDSVDFLENSGTVTLQRVACESPAENGLEVVDPMGGTVSVADCRIDSPGLAGICLENEESGTLNAVITNCEIIEAGREGIALECEDSGPFNVTILDNDILESAMFEDSDEGIYCRLEDGVTGQVLILDNNVSFGDDDGIFVDVCDDAVVDMLIDNNLFRENGSEGLQIVVEDAILNVGITRNVFVDNDTYSCLEAEEDSTVCVRFNDNDYSQDDDDFELVEDGGDLIIEATSGNNPAPDIDSNAEMVNAGDCTDIPTRP